MLRLLRKAVGPGYPADYLLARLAGRRAQAARETVGQPGGDQAGAGDDSRFWQAAGAERSWLFGQLDLELRQGLAPVFVYFELGTVTQALRYLAGDRPGEADRVLQGSMLAPALRNILRGREGVGAALGRLERFLAGTPLAGAGLGASYDQGGLLSCEELLRRRFLLRVLSDRPPPDLALFFQAVVDIRNILATAKWLRWRPESAPLLLPGGRVVLSGQSRGLTQEGLARMIKRFTRGLSLNGEDLRPERLEPLLQAHLQREILRRRWRGGIAAACIDYVWGGFCGARRRSMHLHAGAEAGP